MNIVAIFLTIIIFGFILLLISSIKENLMLKRAIKANPFVTATRSGKGSKHLGGLTQYDTRGRENLKNTNPNNGTL